MLPRTFEALRDLYQIDLWRRDFINHRFKDSFINDVQLQPLFEWVNEVMIGQEGVHMEQLTSENMMAVVPDDLDERSDSGLVFIRYVHEKISLCVQILISFKDKNLPKESLQCWKEYIDHANLIQ